MEAYLTVAQVAAALQVRQETVKRWLNNELLKGRRVGPRKLWRVTQTELERFAGPEYDENPTSVRGSAALRHPNGDR